MAFPGRLCIPGSPNIGREGLAGLADHSHRPQVARQRIQVGMTHAGKPVTIDLADISMRVIDQHGELIATVAPQWHRRDQQVQGLRDRTNWRWRGSGK